MFTTLFLPLCYTHRFCAEQEVQYVCQQTQQINKAKRGWTTKFSVHYVGSSRTSNITTKNMKPQQLKNKTEWQWKVTGFVAHMTANICFGDDFRRYVSWQWHLIINIIINNRLKLAWLFNIKNNSNAYPYFINSVTNFLHLLEQVMTVCYYVMLLKVT